MDNKTYAKKSRLIDAEGIKGRLTKNEKKVLKALKYEANYNTLWKTGSKSKLPYANTSCYPTAIIVAMGGHLLDLIAKETDLGDSHLAYLNYKNAKATSWNVSENRGDSGLCDNGGSRVTVNTSRVYNNKKGRQTGYPSYAWSYNHYTNFKRFGLGAFADVFSHELVHTTDRNIKMWRNKISKSNFEHRTEEYNKQILKKLDLNLVVSRYKTIRKASKKIALKQKLKLAEKTTETKSDKKLRLAEANLAKWGKQLEKAEYYFHKYQTQVNRIQGAKKAALKRAAMKGVTK
jgi:hypothetical protein